MNASEATGADSRYELQSRGRGERMTSSPSLRMNTSSVENWYSFGSRTAWLRLVMKTLAVRGMIKSLRWHYAIYLTYMAPRAQYVSLRSRSWSSATSGQRATANHLPDRLA